MSRPLKPDPTETGLLKAIVDDPGDDTVRLAYADWLDENDRPERAEFIRVQIEIARNRRDVRAWESGGECQSCCLARFRMRDAGVPSCQCPAAYKKLVGRDRDLRAHHAWDWLGPEARHLVAPHPECLTWTRGFVGALDVWYTDWCRNGLKIAAEEPLLGSVLFKKEPGHRPYRVYLRAGVLVHGQPKFDRPVWLPQSTPVRISQLPGVTEAMINYNPARLEVEPRVVRCLLKFWWPKITFTW